jgi:hypothetical protein
MKSEIPDRVKSLVAEIDPSAELYLYGEQCRGDCKNGTDWDFLILLDGPLDSARLDLIRHQLYKVSCDAGKEINVVFKGRQEWNSPENKNVPLYKRIRREGIAL